jgi:seryl-tRNA synthetase
MRSTTAIDLALFREEKGGDPDFIRQSQKARFKNIEDVDRIIILDREWRQSMQSRKIPIFLFTQTDYF